jgi:hypothetical protein
MRSPDGPVQHTKLKMTALMAGYRPHIMPDMSGRPECSSTSVGEDH